MLPGRDDVSFQFLVFYIIVNLSHSKQDIKQIARSLFKIVTQICTMDMVKKLLLYVDRRAFPLLVKDIPDIKAYIDDIQKTDKAGTTSVEEMPKLYLVKKEDEEKNDESVLNENKGD